MKHDCRNLRCISKISDSCFHNLDTCFVYSCLDLILDPASHCLAGTPKASFVCHSVTGSVHIGCHIIWIKPHNIPKGTVALQGKEFLIIVNIEHCLCSIGDTPGNGDPDLYRIAKAVIDLLTVIVQCHDLKRNLL